MSCGTCNRDVAKPNHLSTSILRRDNVGGVVFDGIVHQDLNGVLARRCPSGNRYRVKITHDLGRLPSRGGERAACRLTIALRPNDVAVWIGDSNAYGIIASDGLRGLPIELNCGDAAPGFNRRVVDVITQQINAIVQLNRRGKSFAACRRAGTIGQQAHLSKFFFAERKRILRQPVFCTVMRQCLNDCPHVARLRRCCLQIDLIIQRVIFQRRAAIVGEKISLMPVCVKQDRVARLGALFERVNQRQIIFDDWAIAIVIREIIVQRIRRCADEK